MADRIITADIVISTKHRLGQSEAAEKIKASLDKIINKYIVTDMSIKWKDPNTVDFSFTAIITVIVKIKVPVSGRAEIKQQSVLTVIKIPENYMRFESTIKERFEKQLEEVLNTP